MIVYIFIPSTVYFYMTVYIKIFQLMNSLGCLYAISQVLIKYFPHHLNYIISVDIFCCCFVYLNLCQKHILLIKTWIEIFILLSHMIQRQSHITWRWRCFGEILLISTFFINRATQITGMIRIQWNVRSENRRYKRGY